MKSKCCNYETISEKQNTFWNKENNYCIKCNSYCELELRKEPETYYFYNFLIIMIILFIVTELIKILF
jgi:hypothetical protein